MRRLDIAIVIGLIVSIAAGSLTAFADDCADIRENVVRLHIMAHSDDETDQQLKLDVRDAVLTGTADLFTQSGDRLQIEQTAYSHLEEIRQIAQTEIDRQGYDYEAHVEIVNMFFETRTYEDMTLPAGRYDAIRITIGDGAGKNWWCVMFPPMCIPAAASDDGAMLENRISDLGATPSYKPKFAVVELVEGIRDRFAGEKSPEVLRVGELEEERTNSGDKSAVEK